MVVVLLVVMIDGVCLMLFVWCCVLVVVCWLVLRVGWC